MQFTTLASLLAFAASSLAQTDGYNPLVKPLAGEVLVAGTTYTVEWTLSGAKGPVNLVLYGGPNAQGLQELATVASGIDETLLKYDWAIDASLGKAAAYGLRIALTSNPTTFQWSNGFTIKAADGSGSGSSSSSGSAGTTATSTGKTTATTGKTTLTTTSKISTTTAPTGNWTTTAPTRTDGSTLLPTGTGGSTTTSGTTIPTSGASALGVGSLAVLGGFAMAVLGM